MLPDGPTLTSDMSAQRITWFTPPDRPVEGGTVFVRPDGEIDAVTVESPPAELPR